MKDDLAKVASRCRGAEEIARSVVVLRKGIPHDDPCFGRGQELMGVLPDRCQPVRCGLLGSRCNDRWAAALVVGQPSVSVDRDGRAVDAPVQRAVELAQWNPAGYLDLLGEASVRLAGLVVPIE
jgi:hypothetical protein